MKLSEQIKEFSKGGWHITDIDKCKKFISDIENILQEIYTEIEQDPSEQYGTVEKDKCLRVIKSHQ